MGKILSGENDFTIGESWADGEYLKLDTGAIVSAAVSGSGGGIVYDTQANRPAAATQGREFIPTDGYGPTRQIDSGAAWLNFYNGLQCGNPPATGDLTAVNFGTVATLAAHGDGLLFTNVGSAGTGEHHTMSLVAVPSAPYSLIVGFNLLQMHYPTYTEVGLVWTNGTSNPKFHRFTFQRKSVSEWNMVSAYNSNLTTWNATKQYVAAPHFMLNNVFFMKLSDDSSNRKCWVSVDGTKWGSAIDSNTMTDYFTPTHLGIIGTQSTTSVAATITRLQAKIFHWSLG